MFIAGHPDCNVYVHLCTHIIHVILLLTLGTCVRVTVVVLCVCLHCVDFAENACSKVLVAFADHLELPSLLLGQLSVNKQDSDGFFSSGLVCRTSYGSYNSTDSSLVTVDYQQSFVVSDFFCV